MKIQLSILILLSMNTVLANIISKHTYCLSEFYTQISFEEKLSSNCIEEIKLELTKDYKNYNHIKYSPLEVKYWRGEFSREVITTTLSLRELVNTCRGDIITSQILEDTHKSYIHFTIENPNLDPNITESYKLLPMDDLRANEAFKRTKNNCENYQL